MDYLYIVGAVIVWFVLMRFVLPRFGVRTCMSCCCSVDEPKSCRTKAGERPQDDPQKKTVG